MEVVYVPDEVPKEKQLKAIDSISWLAKAGFDNLAFDLRQYCSVYELEHDVFPERFSEYSDKFVQQCKKLRIKNSTGMAPALPWDTKRTDFDRMVQELTAESILACQKAGCRYIVIGPLRKQMDTQTEQEENLKFYLSFADALPKNFQILIPNHYKAWNGRFLRGAFSDPYELKKFTDELNKRANKQCFGLCVDVGICNLLGQNVYEFLNVLKDSVKAVVIRENDALSDGAQLPFSSLRKGGSRMDWTGIIRGLRKIDFNGQLIFDFKDTVRAYSHLLRADLDVFIKKNVDYFVWQISLEHKLKSYPKRVLFGAGNMCKNYMNCYGTAYPPLFTCDNNEKLWGTKVYGLMVKSPEELKNLPRDCAIFICNVYYKEIRKQILQMGIENPLEYFSDEYLPVS